MLTEYLTSAGEHGAGTMNLDAYAVMTFEDFAREGDLDDEPADDVPSNVIAFRRA